jgi:hypothetical protein
VPVSDNPGYQTEQRLSQKVQMWLVRQEPPAHQPAGTSLRAKRICNASIQQRWGIHETLQLIKACIINREASGARQQHFSKQEPNPAPAVATCGSHSFHRQQQSFHHPLLLITFLFLFLFYILQGTGSSSSHQKGGSTILAR